MRNVMANASGITATARTALAALVIAIAMPAFAQTADQQSDLPVDTTAKANPETIEAVLNTPAIPYPDTGELNMGGNRAQIEAMQQQNARGCALYAQEMPKRENELAKLKNQKAQYRQFFEQMRLYISQVYAQYSAASDTFVGYNKRKMDPEQIALAERQKLLLEARWKAERERLAKAEAQYQQMVDRESYYLNLRDFFPECYDKYETHPDPDVVNAVKAIRAQRAAAAKAAAPAETAPTQRFVPSKSAIQ